MINDNFRCDNNKLTSLEYLPEYIRDEFIYDDNDELPEELQSLDYKLIKTLSKHQLQYGIWNSDNSLNKKRWDIFYNYYMNDNLS